MRDGGHPAAFIHARCGPERAAVLLTVERMGWLDFHLLCTVQAIPGMMRLLRYVAPCRGSRRTHRGAKWNGSAIFE